MTNHNKRILWPDMIKGICMLLVIHSHIVVPHGILYSFYAPVFLAAFFFVSGYFLKERNLSVYVVHEIRTVIVPFLFLGLIDALCYSYLWEVPFLTILRDILLQNGGRYTALWFIGCLIVAKFIQHTAIKITAPWVGGGGKNKNIDFIGFMSLRLRS